MRGGRLHTRNLLDPITRAFRSVGATVTTECPTRSGPHPPAVDLLAEKDGQRIVVEAELRTTRLEAALRKAGELSATELWIVVLNPRTRDAVEKALRGLHVEPHNRGIFVLTLPQALNRVTVCFP